MTRRTGSPTSALLKMRARDGADYSRSRLRVDLKGIRQGKHDKLELPLRLIQSLQDGSNEASRS